LVTDIADHLPIFGHLTLAKPLKKQPNKVPRRFFREKKKDDFLKSLSSKLEKLENTPDPNVLFNKILKATSDAIVEIFPSQIPTKKQELSIVNPWFNKELSNIQRTRDNLKCKWIKHGKLINSLEHLAYKKVRNKFTSMKRKAEKKYFDKATLDANGDSEKMWKVIKKATNDKPKSHIVPDFVKVRTAEGTQVKLDKTSEIVGELNRQFAGMGANLENDLKSTPTSFSEFLPNPNPNHDILILHHVTEAEVFGLIQDLNPSKSTGYDEVPPKIIKWAASLLSPILSQLFNKCLVSGIYPDSLKIARVKPIFKGGNKNDPSSYSPISILSQFNRIFEKILYDRLYAFMKDKLYQKQFGFRPKNSTEHPVLDLKENIYENCTKKQISCILFLDLKKAFDTVSHKILLKKMEYYGVHGVALKLFTSYLANRKQVTCVSALDLIEWGVPQGSVLGPLLFLIFINDIHQASNLGTWLFADDTSLVSSAKSITELQRKMNNEVAKVQDWLLANRLSVHYAQFEYMMTLNL